MQTKPVRKAVIAVAGAGKRFLPQTKAMPKEMLPIINKPVVQLIVEDLVSAGVTDIIIVTGPTKRAIEDHFAQASELENELRAEGKGAQADELQAITDSANFIFLRQKGSNGNARPVLNAAHLLGDEPFFAFFGDDFFCGPVSRAQQLLEAYEHTGSSVISLIEVDRADADKYGMAAIGKEVAEKTFRIKELVEKPGAEKTPSNFASVGGYLLTPDILPILAQEKLDAKGELTLSQSINELAQIADVYGRFIDGTYHDTGTPELYLQSVVDVALDDPQLGSAFRTYLKSRLKQ